MYVISSYVSNNRLSKWLLIDDSILVWRVSSVHGRLGPRTSSRVA